MVIKEADLLFQAEALQVPVIKKNVSGDGWVVTLNGTHKLNPILETARGGTRIFKRLNVAVEVLFNIGISEVKICK